MSISNQNIIHDDDPLIRTHSQEVELPLSAEDEALLMDMYQYVLDSQDDEKCAAQDLTPSVGIAAIQVGVPKKMIAVIVPSEEEGADDQQWALVNPKIISKSTQKAYLSSGEGCLSVPAQHKGAVIRPARIKVRGYDLLSRENVVIEAEGYPAMVLQHEIDHLSGILYYDRIADAIPDGTVEID